MKADSRKPKSYLILKILRILILFWGFLVGKCIFGLNNNETHCLRTKTNN